MSIKLEIIEIWKHRTLLLDIAVTDLKVRYKHSILGFFWSFLEPLLLLIILSLVFTHVFSFEIENYALYLLANLVLWNMFTRSTTMGLTSMIAKAGIITKIYFPRELVVVSSSLTSFFMFVFEFMIFFIFVAAFQFVPSITLAFVPVPLVLLFIVSLGISFGLAVTNVFFRDIQSIWTILLQAGFFLTPIIYKLDILPKSVQELLYYSPLVRIFEMFHNSILYNQLPSNWDITYSVITSLVILVVGFLAFYKFQAKAVEEL